MKINVLHIADAEMEIMKVMWRINRPLTAAEISRMLSHKQWSLSTIHTLAIRLAERGIVQFYKTDGKNYYFAYITEFDYHFVVTKAFVNDVHGGSLAKMMRVLLSDLELTEEELLCLKELVNAAELPRDIWDKATKKEEDQQDSCTDDEAALAEIDDLQETTASDDMHYRKTLRLWNGLSWYRPDYAFLLHDWVRVGVTDYFNSA